MAIQEMAALVVTVFVLCMPFSNLIKHIQIVLFAEL